MKKITLLVFACDRYQKLFKGFEFFFWKNFSEDEYFDFVIATEKINPNIHAFSVLNSGNGAWANRLKRVLEEVKTSHIIFMQEDMWLKKEVDIRTLQEIVDYALSNKLDLLKLHSSGVYKTKPTDIHFNGLRLAKLDNEKSNFLMSHQISIWKKEFFLAQLKDKEHPWRNERKGTKRLKKLNPEIYQIDFFAENGSPAINNNMSESIRSEYHTISVNAMLNHNIVPFIEEMKKEEGTKEYAESLEKQYLDRETHDGKPGLMKKDIFKRIKDFVKGKK